MNRRELLTTLAAVPATAQLNAQPAPNFHFRAGLVAYSYRKELAAKSLSYEDLIRRIADWGLDGLDCTVYWFPDTSAEYLASLRKTAYKNGVQIYNAGVRVQLSQPTAELQQAEFDNIRKWVDVADRIGASHMRVFGGNVPKGATEQQAIAWAAEVLKRGAEYAGSKGIISGSRKRLWVDARRRPNDRDREAGGVSMGGGERRFGKSARQRICQLRGTGALRHESPFEA